MASEESSIRSEINRKNGRIDRLRATNRQLNEKLSRLKEARKKVSNAKNDYQMISKNVRQIVDEKREWKGEQHNESKQIMSELISEDKNAVQQIDSALDVLEMDIAAVENEIIGNSTLIQRLVSSVNTLRHQLKTLGN